MKQTLENHALKSVFVLLGVWFGLGLVQINPAFASVGAATAPIPEKITKKIPEKTPEKQVELKGDPNKTPLELDGVGVKEHLGEKLDLASIEFTDSNDSLKHKLQDYFQSGKPTLINLVYFECPMLCTMVLNGVKDGLKNVSWSAGKEYNILTISINPNDTPALAKFKRENYLKSYLDGADSRIHHDALDAAAGWRFLTGTEDQIKKIAEQLGFEYKYDSFQKQYAHPAVTFVITPDGTISRYLYGITYQPKDLKLALLEASQGKVGSVFDRLLMFCYHYEPSARGYTLQATRVMQAGGVAMLALLGGFYTVFWTRQRKGKTK